jgi:hypothetical protein
MPLSSFQTAFRTADAAQPSEPGVVVCIIDDVGQAGATVLA